jgi:hypothetical protein
VAVLGLEHQAPAVLAAEPEERGRAKQLVVS